MKLIITLFSLMFLVSNTNAQEKISIRGVVKTAEGKPMANASVTLFYQGEKDSLRTVTNDKGIFTFKNSRTANTGILVSYIGYNIFARYYDYSHATGEQHIVDIALTPGSKTLETVTLEASKVQIKEDTVSYKIDSTMYRKNDNVEEVLKKLPGVEVDKAGTVTAQGQQVTKVKVNGKDFFGGDVTTATRQINADMVEKIDIIDDYGDQAAFTGVKNGDATKTLNIQLKKDKNRGYFGNASLGAGTEGRYNNSVTVNKFNDARQISLIGNLNNTNASTFNFGSLGAAAGGIVRSIGGANFGANTANGISTTKSLGLNYRDQWGSKISVYGSYSFTNKGTRTIKDITQQNFFADGTSIYTPKTNDYTVTDNQRFTFNLEYKIDSFNYLKFTPTVNYGSSQSNYLSDFTTTKTGIKQNQGSTTDHTNSTSPNITGSLLFNHRFDKKGRILSLNLNAGKSGTDGNDTYANLTTYYNIVGGGARDSVLNQFITQDNNNHNYGISVSYIEPLNKKQSLEFNYAYNKRYTGIDKETSTVDALSGAKSFIDTLSNIYNNNYTTNRVGVNFRTTQKKYNYTIGLAVQPASISSDSKTTNIKYTQHLVNYYPVIRFAYNFSRSRSFNVNYNGSTSQPSYQQLQPVYDYSNPQYITVGNPDLKPEFTNNLNLRYNNFDFISGNVFFSNLNFTYVKDKIVNKVTSRKFGVQETSYLNSDGYYTASGFYAFSKPFRNRKYVFNYGGNILYNNNVSFIEDTAKIIAKNIGRNFIITQRFSTTITIKKWLETSAGANFTVNDNKYSLNTRGNSTIRSWSLTHSSRFFLPKDFTFIYDLDKTINSGYDNNVGANPLIINSSIEKLISKKYNASLKLNVYDLLNENTSVSRTVTANTITDSRTNKLGRYLLLSFIFRFNKFVGEAPQRTIMGGMRPPHGM
ncbi:MAG: TonB-dependent receptor [Ferruginibacter sp.]